MAYPLLIEQSVELVSAQIKSVFNTSLQEVDNQYDDGISLEPISENAVYISNKIQSLDLPSVFILAGPMAFDYTGDPNYLNGKTDLVVVVASEEIGAEKMQRKAWRYMRALFECLGHVSLNSADGRLQIQCVPRRTGTTEPLVEKLQEFGQKFRSDAVLELSLLHYEKNLT